MSNDEKHQLHELLLKALLSSNIPTSSLENPYFQEYQSKLARSPYQLPLRVQMMDKILPMVHARPESELFDKLKYQEHLTLYLDGWTNNSGNSIYALMALKVAKKSTLLMYLIYTLRGTLLVAVDTGCGTESSQVS
jgi:hypothetical protein